MRGACVSGFGLNPGRRGQWMGRSLAAALNLPGGCCRGPADRADSHGRHLPTLPLPQRQQLSRALSASPLATAELRDNVTMHGEPRLGASDQTAKRRALSLCRVVSTAAVQQRIHGLM